MPDHERKNSLVGIPIGDKGEELNRYLLDLTGKGVNLYPETLSRIRGGFISGDLTAQQLLLDAAKTAKNSLLKVRLYLGITDTGLENRSFQPSHRGRYLSEGFTQTIAEQLILSGGNVRSCLRAMRADLVLYAAQDPHQELLNHFVQKAEDYLFAYTNPPSTIGADQKLDINTNWERASISDFYRRLYSLGAPRAIGTWAPYEVEVFSHLYRLQSTGKWLTPLDNLVFERYQVNHDNSGLVALVRERTATDFNDDALIAHVNALAFGKPINPLISQIISQKKSS